MIPKIIHYCWFGHGELPELYKKCIASWKKYCPNYKFIVWNEENFDINCNQYVKEAYATKKYAFVSDCARLYALYNYGGIYLDTDVEVIKSLDPLLQNTAFAGFEKSNVIETGIIGCEKFLPIFKELLDFYDDKNFYNEDGTLDLTANVLIIRKILTKYGLIANGEYQIINNIAIYPADYFCPMEYSSGKIIITDNTYIIHYFDGSWLPKQQLDELKTYRKVTKIFGVNNGERLLLSKKIIKEDGFKGLFKKIFKR